jgi:hypothetical protein
MAIAMATSLATVDADLRTSGPRETRRLGL